MRASNIAGPAPDSYLIIGLDEIAAVVGRTRHTLRRWRRDEAFPMARLPDGTWCTSITLIDEWLLQRAERDPYVTGEELSFSYTPRSVFLARKAIAEMNNPSEALAILEGMEPVCREAAE